MPILESSAIGEKSCIGYKNCFEMVDTTVGDNSCTGDSIKGVDGYYGYTCAFAKGGIGSDSCYEYASCYQTQAERDTYSWNVGNNSCRGRDACKYSSKWVTTLCQLFCMYMQSTSIIKFLTYCSTNSQPRQLLLALQGLVVMESMHALLWMILPLQLERNLAKTLMHVTRIPQTSEMQAAMVFTDAIRAQQSLDGTVVMENCLAKTILAVSLSIAQVHMI